MRSLHGSVAGLVALMVIIGSYQPISAQSFRRHRGTDAPAMYPDGLQAPRRMIDNPTAGTLKRGSFDTELRAFPDGGVSGILQIGLSNRWMVGIGYGGTDIISAQSPRWNPRMQFLTKIQLLGETMSLPGIAVGFEDMGFGPWIDSLHRFQIKSKGFFAVASKGYRGTNFTSSLHAGMNYSRENHSRDDDIDFFFGSDMRFDNSLGFVVEYDMGLNDDRSPYSLGKGNGYLNLGARWSVLDRIQMEFNLKDLLGNSCYQHAIGRELSLIYVESF